MFEEEKKFMDKMTEVIKRLGLIEWKVVWDPDRERVKENRGVILPDNKIILIHDVDKDATLETLTHEYLEIKMLSMIRPFRVTTNALIKALEKVGYAEKEKAIDSLTPFMLETIEKMIKKLGDEYGSVSPG